MKVVVNGKHKRTHVEQGEHSDYLLVHVPNCAGSKGEDVYELSSTIIPVWNFTGNLHSARYRPIE